MQNKMTPNLNVISKNVSKFLNSLTGINIAPPKVALSKRVNDSAWYSHGKIYINPNYNPEKLTYEEMIAHEFFHHVQTKIHIKYKENLLESSAMFFAAAYMNRKYLHRAVIRKRMLSYLQQKKHMPKGGNYYLLLRFKRNRYDIKKTLHDLLMRGARDLNTGRQVPNLVA